MINKKVCVVQFATGNYAVKVSTTYLGLFNTTYYLTANFCKHSEPSRVRDRCTFPTKEEAYNHMQKYLLTHKEL